MKKLSICIWIVLALCASTWTHAQSIPPTDSLTLPEKNLLNGIRYIRNGRIAAMERDSLRSLVGIKDAHILQLQKLILNFEVTELQYKQIISNKEATEALYKQQNDLLQQAVDDSKKALKEQKRRNTRNLIIAGAALTTLFLIKGP